MTIRKLQPLARRFNGTAVAPETKYTDPFYLTPQYRSWSNLVVMRAGRRCQAVDDGYRCTKSWPEHRVFADHVVEIQDGGSRFDPANGFCCCASHHSIKTMRERAKRLGSVSKKDGPSW